MNDEISSRETCVFDVMQCLLGNLPTGYYLNTVNVMNVLTCLSIKEMTSTRTSNVVIARILRLLKAMYLPIVPDFEMNLGMFN
jgi:hypothetical protein